MKIYRLVSILVLITIFSTSNLLAQDNAGKVKTLDSNALPLKPNVQLLQKDAKEYKKEYKKEHRAVVKFAQKNALPVRQIKANGKIIQLQRIDQAGQPVYYTTFGIVADNIKVPFSTEAAVTTSTDKVWQGGTLGLGLDGSSAAINGKLGIWDGAGVRNTHRELTGRVTQVDQPTDQDGRDHATHVAGIMAATGISSRAKGMAFKTTLKAYDWNNDISEVTTAAAAGLLLSNHSYGIGNIGWVYNDERSGNIKWEWHGNTTIDATEDYRFGYYNTDARQADRLALNAPGYLMVVASGNNRSDSGPGEGASYYLGTTNVTSTVARRDQNSYDLLSGTGVAKNVLTVGAVSAITGGYQTTTDAKAAFFSNWGPTDDGRIKPDLVGDGVAVFSSVATADDAYASYSGTSMAAPNVTGSLFLLQEHYSKLNQNNFMRAATLKGLAIHTADEAGPTTGPDYSYGWGLLNTAQAASVITNTTKNHLIAERSLNSNETYSFEVIASGNGPLVATLSWTDPAATPLTINAAALNNRTSRLINDLDMQVTNSNNTWLPWVLNPANPSVAATTGDNTLDNVEQVLVANPVAGSTYKITIKHKGTLTNNTQPYSLIVSGLGGQTYCVSKPNSDQGARITNVTFGSINNTPTAACTTYSDFTNLYSDVVINSNLTIPLSLSLGSCTTNANKIAKVFIDWNHDFDFDDANELVATSNVISGNGTFTTQVQVPTGLEANIFTRLRVVGVETSQASAVAACGTYDQGETQDYSLRFINPANDVGPVAVVLPDSTVCAGPQTVKVKIQNYGSNSLTNIKVTAQIKQGNQEIKTLSGIYTETLETNREAHMELTGTFTATAGATYTISLTSDLSNDEVTANNTYTTTVTIKAQTAAPVAQAISCSSDNISLTASGAGTAFWYDAPTGGNLMAAGNQTTAAAVPANNTFYVGLNDFYGTLAPAAKTAFGSGNYGGGYQPMPLIKTSVPVMLDSARLYIGNPGKVTFTVETPTDSIVSSTTLNVKATRTTAIATDAPDDLNDKGAMYALKLAIPRAGNYHIRITYEDGATVFRSNTNVSGYPFTIPHVISLNGALYDGDTLTTAYYYLYNLKVKALDCPSERVAVVPQSLAALNAIVSATGATTFCTGEAVELKANVPAGVNIQWQKDGTALAGATALNYTASKPGSYSFTLTNGTCVAKASNAVQVTVTTLVKPVITLQNTTLTASTLTGNQWLLDGIALEGAESATLVAPETGNYALIFTQNGCSITSDVVYVFVEEPEVVQSFTLNPNPTATNSIQIKYTSPSFTDKVSVTVYNVIGNVVRTFTIAQQKRGLYQQELNLAGLANGVYFVRIKDGTQTLVKKFIKID